MRIIYAGTPNAAVPTLEVLLESSHEVVAVLTRPPARQGRGRTLHPSPVAHVAASAGVPLIEASSMKDAGVQKAIEALDADLGVVVAYGALIPQHVLDMPEHGWINLHFSDLPRWRGAAPVQWAILEGDPHTASSVFQLEAGLDTGPVFSRHPIDSARQSSGELLETMAHLGAAQVLSVVEDLASGMAQATPQDVSEPATHARRLTTADGFIDFAGAAAEVDQRIRATTPNPGAWTTLPDGRRLKLGPATPTLTPTPGEGVVLVKKAHVQVGCADTTIELGQVAPAGKGWMDAAAWARGARLDAGTRLGLPQEGARQGSAHDGLAAKEEDR